MLLVVPDVILHTDTAFLYVRLCFHVFSFFSFFCFFRVLLWLLVSSNADVCNACVCV